MREAFIFAATGSGHAAVRRRQRRPAGPSLLAVALPTLFLLASPVSSTEAVVPLAIECANTGDDFAGEAYVYVLCPPDCIDGRVWGSDTYTRDSHICTAAIHAGAVTAQGGGELTVYAAPGLTSYSGSTANNITTFSYSAWGDSFTVVTGTPTTTTPDLALTLSTSPPHTTITTVALDDDDAFAEWDGNSTDNETTTTTPAPCACLYEDSRLPASFWTSTPFMTERTAITLRNYGTSCAAWDTLHGTPLYGLCPAGSDFCSLSFNWCTAPWCYVDARCPGSVRTSLFFPQDLHYSYEACGAPNCYSEHDSPECPYDPVGNCTDAGVRLDLVISDLNYDGVLANSSLMVSLVAGVQHSISSEMVAVNGVFIDPNDMHVVVEAGSIVVQASGNLDSEGIQALMGNATRFGNAIVQEIRLVHGICLAAACNISESSARILERDLVAGANVSVLVTDELDGFWRSSEGPLVHVLDGYTSFDGRGRYPIISTNGNLTQVGFHAVDLSEQMVRWVLDNVTVFWHRLETTTSETSTTTFATTTRTSISRTFTSITTTLTSTTTQTTTLSTTTFATSTDTLTITATLSSSMSSLTVSSTPTRTNTVSSISVSSTPTRTSSVFTLTVSSTPTEATHTTQSVSSETSASTTSTASSISSSVSFSSYTLTSSTLSTTSSRTSNTISSTLTSSTSYTDTTFTVTTVSSKTYTGSFTFTSLTSTVSSTRSLTFTETSNTDTGTTTSMSSTTSTSSTSATGTSATISSTTSASETPTSITRTSSTKSTTTAISSDTSSATITTASISSRSMTFSSTTKTQSSSLTGSSTQFSGTYTTQTSSSSTSATNTAHTTRSTASISSTSAAREPAPVSAVVAGSLEMQVADPVAMLRHPQAAQAITEALLDLAGLSRAIAPSVQVNLAAVRGRRLRAADSRRLTAGGGLIRADYTIVVPHGDHEAAAAQSRQIVSALGSATAEDFSSSVGASATRLLGRELAQGLSVTSVQQPVVRIVFVSPEEEAEAEGMPTMAMGGQRGAGSATTSVGSVLLLSLVGSCGFIVSAAGATICWRKLPKPWRREQQNGDGNDGDSPSCRRKKPLEREESEGLDYESNSFKLGEDADVSAHLDFERKEEEDDEDIDGIFDALLKGPSTWISDMKEGLDNALPSWMKTSLPSRESSRETEFKESTHTSDQFSLRTSWMSEDGLGALPSWFRDAMPSRESTRLSERESTQISELPSEAISHGFGETRLPSRESTRISEQPSEPISRGRSTRRRPSSISETMSTGEDSPSSRASALGTLPSWMASAMGRTPPAGASPSRGENPNQLRSTGRSRVMRPVCAARAPAKPCSGDLDIESKEREHGLEWDDVEDDEKANGLQWDDVSDDEREHGLQWEADSSDSAISI